ncbi:MAG TPA: TIGR04086 family membrane protein [Candidatus Fournierella merdigallinarum]|nr:TIGR04086 family membrane protein [Candidatus Fournierella merdigallinarum]
MAKQRTAAQAAKRSTGGGPLGAILAGAVSGLGVTFAALLGCSWAYTKTQIPAWCAAPLAACSAALGCFVCGFVLARGVRKNGLFCGLCAGVGFFLLYLAAALLNGQFEFTAMAGIKLVCDLLAGCLGGFLGVTPPKKKKSRLPA